MNFELVVQQAIFEILTADPDIIERNVSVYDEVPQPDDSGDIINFPYVVVGDDQSAAWDTDTELGADITATIHTWSRYRGKKETKELQGLVYAALNRAESKFDIAGYKVVLCDFLTSQSFLDTDGKTRHGVQTFRILIEKL
jgi:Protein of unknown function (DUF3168)